MDNEVNFTLEKSSFKFSCEKTLLTNLAMNIQTKHSTKANNMMKQILNVNVNFTKLNKDKKQNSTIDRNYN